MSDQAVVVAAEVAGMMDVIQRMAKVVASSGSFGCKSPDQAEALLWLAHAEGKHPMTAVREFHVIQGRVAMKAEAMLARFQASGGKLVWQETNEKVAKALVSHPANQPQPVAFEWTIDRASRVTVESWEGEQGARRKTTSKLTDKDVWKNYPAQMLRARVITEAVRAVHPGCVLGLVAVEETETLQQAESSVIASETGKGVPGLAAAVAQIAPPTTPKVDPERAKKLAEVRRRMKADGVATPDQARQYVADNLGGLVVDKLDDLRDDDLDRLVAIYANEVRQ